MTPISNEKRALIIVAKKRNEKEEDIAKWLEISKSTVGKIWKLYKDTDNYLPKPYPGRQPLLSTKEWKAVKDLIAIAPDKTLEEIITELSLPIRKSRLSVLLIEAGYSFKKRQFIRLSKTEKMSKKRDANLSK